jgi:hypothetical protein
MFSGQQNKRNYQLSYGSVLALNARSLSVTRRRARNTLFMRAARTRRTPVSGDAFPVKEAPWPYFIFDFSLIFSPATMKWPLPR